MPGEHVFVDESKRDVYLIVAAVVASSDVTATRTTLRALRPPGTHRVHFQAENDARRRRFLQVTAALPITARIYTARRRTDRESRQMILTRLVGDAVDLGAARLVLERDDSLIVHDQRTIREERSRQKAADQLRFDHLRSLDDPMLWLPDAIAWAWCRDRRWRALVQPLISEQIAL